MKRLMLVLALAVNVVACGDEGDGGDDDDGRLVRVSIGALQNGGALDFDDGLVEAGDDTELYDVLMRFSRIVVRAEDGHTAEATSLNVNVLEGALALETRFETRPVSITLELDAPSADSGVIPGEAVSVFMGGLLDADPLEYRDSAMDAMTLDIPATVTTNVAVRFDIAQWFDDIDDDDLTPMSGSGDDDDDDESYRIDSTHNTAAAALIESRVRASVRICESCGR